MYSAALLPSDIVSSLTTKEMTDLKKFVKRKLPSWFAAETDNKGIMFSSLDEESKYDLVNNPHLTDNLIQRLWKFDSQHLDASHKFLAERGHQSVENLLWNQSFLLMTSFFAHPLLSPETVSLMMFYYLNNNFVGEKKNERLRILYYYINQLGTAEKFSPQVKKTIAESFLESGETHMAEKLLNTKTSLVLQ